MPDIPAFPGKIPFGNTRGEEAADFAFTAGMELRDYFAAKAMQGFCSRAVADSPRGIAAVAYGMADAMLAARSKK